MTTQSDHLRLVRNEIENYNQTVDALLSFAAFVVHDGESRRPNAEFGFGRRMTTSPSNPLRPSSDVSPDLVAQKSENYGVVGEAKKSLSRNESAWTEHLKRLQKYDDSLTGWWTNNEEIVHSDTTMLIHQSRARRFTRFVEKQKELNAGSIGPTISIVEFNRSDEAATYFFFRLEFGSIHDQELAERLDNGVPIPLDKIRLTFPNIRYYDADPPIPLLLMHLWTDVFPSMLERGEYSEATKSTQIPVSVSEVTLELQEAFGSGALRKDERSVEFPRKKWVREAFERLVKHRFAIPPTSGDDNFTILYRKILGDVLDRFIKLEMPPKKHEKETDVLKDQISMFPGIERK